ncbi:MAG: FIST C-terminal domain-containing protein, partial [Alphaproteobacteria bacterium]
SEGGNVLSDTTLNPLGRRRDAIAGFDYFLLSHPDSVTKDGALSLFSDIAVGEEITLMEGTSDNLVQRASRVAEHALEMARLDKDQLAGALVIYCAGCMLTVQDRMDEVAQGLQEALGNKPFLGNFTFGEQGCFVGGSNHHGNLMISVVVFGSQTR